jgi:hypothetical protein
MENDLLRLRGHSDRFAAAKIALDKFCDDNYTLENIYSEEDVASFLSNRKLKNANGNNENNETLAKKIENDYNVNLFFNRKQNIVRISGVKLAVLAAEEAISRILHGDCATGESVLIPMNSLAIASLIGKGGKNITEFERKYNVMIDILRSREQVRLRGIPNDVHEATKGLLKLIDKLRISTILTIGKKPKEKKVPSEPKKESEEEGEGEEEEVKYEDAVDPENDDDEEDNEEIDGAFQHYDREKLLEIASNCNKFYGTDVVVQAEEQGFIMQGTKKQIEYSKKFICDELKGTSQHDIPLLKHHIDHFQYSANSMEKLIQQGRAFNLNLSVGPKKLSFSEDRYLNYNHSITIQGSNNIMMKAKINIYRLLDHLFPAEFISIPIDNYILRSLWSDSLLAYDLFKLYPTVSITYDMVMSCIRIIGTDSILMNQVMSYLSFILKSHTSLEIDREILPLVLQSKNQISLQFNKATDVHIQFPSTNKLAFYISTGSEVKTTEAKEKLLEIINKLVKENWQITVSPEVLGTLIGKQGATINKIRADSKANVEVDMKTRIVKVSGKEENLLVAKNIISQIIANKLAEGHQVKLSMTRECIPVIIGTKGVTIREIRQVSGVVSLDIDRKTDQFILIKGRFVEFPICHL